MVNNPIELGRAFRGFRDWGEPKNPANVSREINVEARDPANREIVDVRNDSLENRNGGVVPERRTKLDGFVKWASSVNGFRAFALTGHSSFNALEGVNREINEESGVAGGKNTSAESERAIDSDGFVSGVNVDEGEDNVVGGVECVGNDWTGVNVVVDLNAKNCAGNKRLSGHGIGGKGIAAEEVFNESNVYDGGVNNVAASCNKLVGLNDNQDVLLKEATARDRYFMVPKISGEECRTEKEGEYFPSDLVWGKVTGHPWWPGQIFEPSAASKKALKHFKNEGYLVAYFGDQTFAWNEAAMIKPFRMHFCAMEKRSNLEEFSEAVGYALDEVSRRVEFGLSCPCLPEEQLSKIDSQIVVNGGILEEASKRYGGDRLSSASAFRPADLLRDFKSLAASPTKSGVDRLTFVVVKAQLLAFNRWKDIYELPEFVELDDEASCGEVQLGNQDENSKGKSGRKRGSSSSSQKHEAVESVPSASNLKRRKMASTPSMQKGSPSTPTLGSEAENPAVPVDENIEEYSPTALSLTFSDSDSVPDSMDFINIFSCFGPLNESETEVSTKSKRAKVVFKRRSDAETAFSKAEKSRMFGTSLVSCRLKPLRITTPTVTKQDKKAGKSA